MPLRVAVLADYLEEGWPSMDLVADMLVDRLQREHGSSIDAALVRPQLQRRLTRVPTLRARRAAFGVDRVYGRLWDYPRHAARLASSYDVFHIVDHSYSQLVHRLPPGRTVVTCHDLDTFRSVLDPQLEPRSRPFRAMTRHILEGLRKAGHITCDSAATRDALISRAGVDPDRATVVHNGPHPSCTPEADAASDSEAARLLGHRGPFLLNVGSTIPRKRIDVLLRVFAAVREAEREVTLVRVGGPFTAWQRGLARDLGVADHVIVLPVLDRSTLAAVYRRSALLLMPSEREGFGLPLLESMACGTPVVASDIAPLREVGGSAATYCGVEDTRGWAEAVVRLLRERSTAQRQWTLRRESAMRRAAAFSWSRYAAEIAAIYARVGGA